MLQLRSLQYLERYIYLILFNAYLHLEKKDSWQRPFSLWMCEVRLLLPKPPARPRSTLYVQGAGKQTTVFHFIYDFRMVVADIVCSPFAAGELPSHWAGGSRGKLGRPLEMGGIPLHGWGAPPIPNLPFSPLLSFPGFYFNLPVVIAASGVGRPTANLPPAPGPSTWLALLAPRPTSGLFAVY